MRRLAIGIAVGLATGPLIGCDKREGDAATVPGEGKPQANSDRPGDVYGVYDMAASATTLEDALKLIPDGADFLVGIDGPGVVNSEVVQDNRDTLMQGTTGRMLAAADHCNVGMSTWKYSIVGGNSAKHNALVVIFSATDVGEKGTLRCIGEAIVEENLEKRLDVVEENGRVVVTGGKDGQKIYGLSDDAIALVGADWDQAFNDRLGGHGKAALDGSLVDVFAAVDMSKHIYFGMVANAELQRELTATLEYVTGTIDLSAGLDVVLSGELADRDTAGEFSRETSAQFAAIKEGFPDLFSIPMGVVDTVKIEASGAAVVVSASARGNDLRLLSEVFWDGTDMF